MSNTFKYSMALQSVLAERMRQDKKWGEQNHDPFMYLTILGEEFGETCQAALDLRFNAKFNDPALMEKLRQELRNEAVQTAAVALAIVECLDRAEWRWSLPPPPKRESTEHPDGGRPG